MKNLNLILLLALAFILTGCDATFSDEPARERGIGAAITKPYTFSPSGVIRSSEMNSNFDTIYTLVNGNLNNANIIALAGIAASKIQGTAVVLTPTAYSQIINSAITLNGALLMSTTTGAFLPPSLTAAQRDALTPTAGWTHWNTSSTSMQYYDGSNWQEFSSGASAYTGGDGIAVTGNSVAVDLVASNGLEFSSNDELTVSTSTNIILEGGNLSVSTSTTYAWTGAHTFSATTTMATSTIVELTVSNDATFNGILYIGATSSASLVDSTNADDLHDHNLIGTGSKYPKDYWNFSIPFLISSNISSGDFWTATNLSVSGNHSSQYFVSAPTGAPLLITASSTFPGLSWDDGKDVIVEFGMQTVDGVNEDHGIGLIQSSIEELNTSATDAVIFLIWSDALYAKTSNAGVGLTNKIITGITLTDMNTYRIEFDAGVSAKFYVNGSLATTTTTTLPDGTTDIKFGFGGLNATDYIKYVTEPMFSVEK